MKTPYEHIEKAFTLIDLENGEKCGDHEIPVKYHPDQLVLINYQLGQLTEAQLELLCNSNAVFSDIQQLITDHKLAFAHFFLNEYFENWN